MGVENGLVLTDRDGDSADPKYGNNTSQRGDYVKARVTGSYTFYVVYSQTDFLGSSRIVRNRNTEDVGFVIRSFQGRDKQGIVLFTHVNYCGQAGQFIARDDDITDMFPSGGEGASSAITCSGKWRLYKETNCNGPVIQDLEGGTDSPQLARNDKCKSLKLI